MGAKSTRPASTSLKLAQSFRTLSVSYHESGHAICALLYFMNVSDVKINELKNGVGGITNYHMVYHNDKYDQIDAKVKDYLILSELYMLNAGLAAEKIYFKDLSGSDRFPMVLKFGVEPDMREVSQIIKKYNLVAPGQKRYLYKKKVFRYTTSILKEYWDDVKLLAHNLYERRKLQYDDLKQLLTRKSKNKKFWKKQFKSIDILFKELDNDQVVRILLR